MIVRQTIIPENKYVLKHQPYKSVPGELLEQLSFYINIIAKIIRTNLLDSFSGIDSSYIQLKKKDSSLKQLRNCPLSDVLLGEV